ncbi:MAG: type I restriction endonuclease [Blautia sp.]
MDFKEQINLFADRINVLRENISTEEATKTSIILPFFQILGYDVFNPLEFVPEFTADTGTKRGEKVDYAILQNNTPLILIEAKSANTDLSLKHINQLFRYFTVTKAKFAILTNGFCYRFFSDLEEPNKMDNIPFFEFDFTNINDDAIRELKRFQKDCFDLKSIINSASELKYRSMIKKTISELFQNPSDQLVRALISKNIYSGTKTQAVLDKFRSIIKISFNDYVNEIINERIKTAISPNTTYQDEAAIAKPATNNLTQKELEVLDYIKNILNTTQDIVYKKTSAYICMQLGQNSRKWICRIFLRQDTHLFVLHKFHDTNYECEYYFDSLDQLELIRELIIDVLQKCIANR